MIKQILVIYREVCRVRKERVKTIKQIIDDYRYIQSLRKGGVKK